MGIGIGWPNASVQGGTVYSFPIYQCDSDTPSYVYSLSPAFDIGITVYNDPELTILTNTQAGANPYPGLVYYITNGIIINEYNVCGG